MIWYDWYIPINKIEIADNGSFIPLASINTYGKQKYLQTKQLVVKNNAREKKHVILHKVKMGQAQ